jgi:hypothetical protein
LQEREIVQHNKEIIFDDFSDPGIGNYIFAQPLKKNEDGFQM